MLKTPFPFERNGVFCCRKKDGANFYTLRLFGLPVVYPTLNTTVWRLFSVSRLFYHREAAQAQPCTAHGDQAQLFRLASGDNRTLRNRIDRIIGDFPLLQPAPPDTKHNGRRRMIPRLRLDFIGFKHTDLLRRRNIQRVVPWRLRVHLISGGSAVLHQIQLMLQPSRRFHRSSGCLISGNGASGFWLER